MAQQTLTMTPKEKAIQLVKNFEEYCEGVMEYQKDCALIAVEEIIEATNMHQFALANGRKTIPAKIVNHPYWQEVKQEIVKL